MTLELTIQDMFDRFPLIFQTRTDCLNHLFCVLGNSYAWEGGELVDGDGTEPVHALVDGKARQYVSYRSPVPSRPRRERWYFVRKLPGKPETVELYKQYVPLWNVPADVRPDWLDGVL